MNEVNRSQKFSKEPLKSRIFRELLGKVVLTKYNNKTYRIDDLDFNSSPESQFQKGGKLISFTEYYKNEYGIEINDLKQPMIVSFIKGVRKNSNSPEKIYLVPSIVYMTGFNDRMRENRMVRSNIFTKKKKCNSKRTFFFISKIEVITLQ